MNTALLLSGGTGSRIHTKVPKQYMRVRGRMLVTCALEPLLRSRWIDAVQIVAGPEWREPVLANAEQSGLSTEKIVGFSVPGANRQSSILHGLQDLSRLDIKADTVLIHDAARPLLKEIQIENCYRSLKGHDGVMPVLPMKDTVYFSRDGVGVDKLLERSCIFAGQAPELFCFETYFQANLALLPDRILRINGSAEPAVLAGMDIVMIPGDEGNYKITTKADLDRFLNGICGT